MRRRKIASVLNGKLIFFFSNGIEGQRGASKLNATLSVVFIDDNHISTRCFLFKSVIFFSIFLAASGVLFATNFTKTSPVFFSLANI